MASDPEMSSEAPRDRPAAAGWRKAARPSTALLPALLRAGAASSGQRSFGRRCLFGWAAGVSAPRARPPRGAAGALRWAQLARGFLAPRGAALLGCRRCGFLGRRCCFLGRRAASSAGGAASSAAGAASSRLALPAAASGSGTGLSVFTRRKAMMAARFLSSGTPGKAIAVPGAKAWDSSARRRALVGPVALVCFERRRVAEALDRRDLSADHAVEIGTDDGRAALLKAVADLAQRRVGLALFGVGLGNEREEGCIVPLRRRPASPRRASLRLASLRPASPRWRLPRAEAEDYRSWCAGTAARRRAAWHRADPGTAPSWFPARTRSGSRSCG